MPQELPQPGTASELYLAAILDELRALRTGRQRPEPSGDEVELREPERPKRRKG